MPTIDTRYLTGKYDAQHNNAARCALGYGETVVQDVAVGSYALEWHNRRVDVSGIDVFEASDGETPLGVSCSCPKASCRHGLAALWHRALAAEGVTREKWWEDEKVRRLGAVEQERLEREREERRQRDEWRRNAAERAERERERQEDQRIRAELHAILDQPDRSDFTYVFDFDEMTVRLRYQGHDLSAYDQSYGGYARRGYGGYAMSNPARDRYLRSTDARIAQTRAMMELIPGGDDAKKLTGDMAKALLDMAVRQGTARDAEDQVITRGAPMRLRGEWTTSGDGSQRFQIVKDMSEDLQLYDLGEIFGYDHARGEIVHVDCGMPHAAFRALTRMADFRAERSESMRRVLGERLPEEALPRVINIDRRRVRPKARLTLDEVSTEEGRRQQASVALEYAWGTVQGNLGGTVEGVRRMEGDRLVVEERDLDAEREILAAIPDATLARSDRRDGADGSVFTFEKGEVGSLAFRRDVLPGIQESDDYIVDRTDNWSSDLVEWLDGEGDFVIDDGVGGSLAVSISPGLEGLDRDILPALAEMARQITPDTDHSTLSGMFAAMLERPAHPVRRRSEGVMLVPYDVLIRLLPAIWHLVNAGMTDQGGMDRIAATDISHLGTDVTLRMPERIRRLLDIRAAMDSGKRVRIPRSFNKEEKVDQAQKDGLRWMTLLHEAGYGGILADEVGVGKTLQILLHAASLRERGGLKQKALIVVPKTSVGEWKKQAERFFPTIPCVVWEGAERRLSTGAVSDPLVPFVVTTPYCVVNDPEIRERAWSLVAIDEAQDARNPATDLAAALREIEADQKIPTSGTPVENHLGDAWSLMEIACSGLLGTRAEFGEHVQRPIEKLGDLTRQRQFARFLEPFVLRRTREEAGHNVPKPLEVVHRLRVGDDQARVYETIRLTSTEEFGEALSQGGTKWRRCVLPILTRLRQACCHPALVKADYARELAKGCGSAKTSDMVRTALECKAEGRRILVFSSWTENLELIRHEFQAVGLKCDIIHGGLSTKKREAALNRFRDTGELDALMITTKTGGRSLNIPEADDVFISDPWWNPQPEIQAIGRTQRRGQTKTIRVHRFIIEDSIETRIMRMQARKIAIANMIHNTRNDREAAAALTIEDMKAILEPLGVPV